MMNEAYQIVHEAKYIELTLWEIIFDKYVSLSSFVIFDIGVIL